MSPDSPLAQRLDRELSRLRDLLTARTNGDGTPRKGLKANVIHLRARISELERQRGARG